MNTIRCDECRELLLAAEPVVLRAGLPTSVGEAGVGDAGRDEPLREHLRACPQCASLAAALLAENAALDAALRRLSADQARPSTGSSQAAGSKPAGLRDEARTPRRRVSRWSALVPLAVAAVLLVLWQPWVAGPRPLPPLAGPQEQVPATPVVNATGASVVAVMRTSNPNITIVWTF